MKITITNFLVVLAVCFFTYKSIQMDQQRIAYVYVNNVLEEYHAMQDMNDRLKVVENRAYKTLDGMYQTLQEEAKWLRSNYNSLSQEEIGNKQLEIGNMERVFMDMQQKSNTHLDSLRAKSIEPIYDEVNQFIKDYGEEQGYSFVLGNLGNGNIMYASGASDITLEVIDGLNVAYNKIKKD